jgi:hypothetical protein
LKGQGVDDIDMARNEVINTRQLKSGVEERKEEAIKA